MLSYIYYIELYRVIRKLNPDLKMNKRETQKYTKVLQKKNNKNPKIKKTQNSVGQP